MRVKNKANYPFKVGGEVIAVGATFDTSVFKNDVKVAAMIRVGRHLGIGTLAKVETETEAKSKK